MDSGTRDGLLSHLAEAVRSVTVEKALDRSRIRDQTPLMSGDEVEQRYRGRYIPSQQFYFKTARPAEHADIIVYNDEPLQPTWQTRTPEPHP